MIEVLVFDLDDTLFPEHEFVLSGFQAVSSWLVTKYSISSFFKIAWQFFKEGKRNNIFNITLEELQIEYDPSLIQELVQIYRQHEPTISLHKDAEWAIAYFKTSHQLGVITDGFLITQQNKVKALGIEPHFNQIVYTDFYGRECWKPSPFAYQKIMRSLGCCGKKYVYVADNPYKDFITAKNLDWLTVQIYREDGEYSNIIVEKSHDADLKINSLLDLKSIL